MPSNRTAKEESEARLIKKITKSFDKTYERLGMSRIQYPVSFTIYPRLKKEKRYYLGISYNERTHIPRVDLNPILLDEQPKIVDEQGIRAAIKIFLFFRGQDFDETSESYIKLSRIFKVWNYGGLPEVPLKWHVYSCSRCGRHMLAYSKKLPNDSYFTDGLKTLWHKKRSESESEKPHQGIYSYTGPVELKNWELQQVLNTMKIIDRKNHGLDTERKTYYDEEYLSEHPELDDQDWED